MLKIVCVLSASHMRNQGSTLSRLFSAFLTRRESERERRGNMIQPFSVFSVAKSYVI